MTLRKIPLMTKPEYNRLIEEQHLSRIAFKGGEYPYVVPFLYVFDGKFMYFLSTRYGRKIQYFSKDPRVCVEIEEYDKDFSDYCLVVLLGCLVEVKDIGEQKIVREKFVQLIKDKNISQNIMVLLGHSPQEPVESIGESDRTLIWKLVDVKNITGLAYPRISTSSPPIRREKVP